MVLRPHHGEASAQPFPSQVKKTAFLGEERDIGAPGAACSDDPMVSLRFKLFVDKEEMLHEAILQSVFDISDEEKAVLAMEK